MGKYSVPESIRKLKPKGTMVKAIRGKYYVYEYFHRKNEQGKWSTKMGKMIGSIDAKLGFIPNDNFITKDEITSLEYGQYAIAINNSKDTLDRLLAVFNPLDAYPIYMMGILHFVNGFTYLKSIHHYYEQSYISLLYPSIKMSYKALAPLVDSLGRKQTKVIQFQQNLEIGKGNYSEEGYHKVKDYFGVIAIQTNCTGKSAKEIYELYKKRWKIETFYNYFKNDVDISALHISNYYMAQGLAFIMLIVGLIHSEVGKAVKEVRGKTVEDCLLEARFVKLSKRNRKWAIANMKKDLRLMMETLGIDEDSEMERIN